MRLFAVRVIEDKQPVGFFWAPHFTALWWMIDSVCDPGECEYVRIKNRAAITWQGRVKAKFGEDLEFNEAGESKALNELRREMSFDYAFEDFIFGITENDWIKVPFADEEGGGLHELYERKTSK